MIGVYVRYGNEEQVYVSRGDCLVLPVWEVSLLVFNKKGFCNGKQKVSIKVVSIAIRTLLILFSDRNSAYNIFFLSYCNTV